MDEKAKDIQRELVNFTNEIKERMFVHSEVLAVRTEHGIEFYDPCRVSIPDQVTTKDYSHATVGPIVDGTENLKSILLSQGFGEILGLEEE